MINKIKAYFLRIIFKTLLLSICFVSYQAFSNQNSIAIVDLSAIFEKSDSLKIIKQKVSEITLNIEKDIKEEEMKLKKLDLEISEKKNFLSENEYSQELLKLHRRYAGMQKTIQDRKSRLEQAYSHAINKVHKQINIILKKLAMQKGFNIVLPISISLYYSASLDITKEVIDSLNKTGQKVNLEYK